MGFARAIHPHTLNGQGWSWKLTTPGLLVHAVKTYGWGFIPNQVLPPLLANVRSVNLVTFENTELTVS